MKKQILTFNDLLRRLNKYRNKLARLQENGINSHRQGVLLKHIERLIVKLNGFHFNMQRKAILAASFTAIMGIGIQETNAQIDFYSPEPNPFNLSSTTGYMFAVSFADLDNDGDYDAISGTYSGDVHYFENTGTASAPSFNAEQVNPFSLTTVPNNFSTEFVDLDGDGDFDLMHGNVAGEFIYVENTGTVSAPAFGTPQMNPFSLTTTGSYLHSSFVDIDDDGDFDLMAGEETSDFHYFENIGTSTSPNFAVDQTNPFSLSSSTGWLSPSFGDVDGDGDFDLLSGRGGLTSFFENTGTSAVPVFGPEEVNSFALSPIYNGQDPCFVDLNNDGDLDMIQANNVGDFFYFGNIGTPTVSAFENIFANPFSLASNGVRNSATLGDLDGDGDLDILTGDNNGDFAFYENIGSLAVPVYSVFQSNPFSLTNIGSGSLFPEFVDLDADGDLDLMTGEGFGELIYFENTGTTLAPSFGVMQTNPYSIVTTGLWSSRPTFGDLDNDGDLDILNGSVNQGLSYFENTGTSSVPVFAAFQTNPFSLMNSASNSSPSFVDLDEDGDLDALVCSNNGWRYQENIGTASVPNFDVGVVNPFSLFYGTGNPSPTFGDLDGDGDLDLLTGGNSGDFYYFENISGCSVNTSVTQTGNTLTADQAGAIEYYWVDCDDNFNIIPGETNQSFTPTVNGNYACEVTLVGCADYTECIAITTIGLDEVYKTHVNVYPNPATDQITIDSEDEISSILIFDLSGVLIQSETTASFSIEGLDSGIYMLNVKTSTGLARVKFMKQ
ncbi:MAG: hypothetical protein ACJA0U_000174 [Salibacteraceae bacterium]|jgi:hypothetical protein